MTTGVQFEGDKYQDNFNPNMQGGGGQGDSKLSQWLIDKGIVKDESGAQKFLVGVIIVNIIIIFVVYKFFL